MITKDQREILEALRKALPEKVRDNVGATSSDIDWGSRLGYNTALQDVGAIIDEFLETDMEERGDGSGKYEVVHD